MADSKDDKAQDAFLKELKAMNKELKSEEKEIDELLDALKRCEKSQSIVDKQLKILDKVKIDK